MSALFEVKPHDREFYEQHLRDFLPKRLIDVHTHVWKDEFAIPPPPGPSRTVSWPSLVARDNSIEDLEETYRLLFPDRQVTPLIFTTLDMDYERANAYCAECAATHHCHALVFSHPAWSAAELERRISAGHFLGAKSYLSLAPAYLPVNEIRIYDFFPPHQLEVLEAHGWIAMLHVPRPARLKDQVNLAQLVEIDRRYPRLRTIVAHVGRAYSNEDVGEAFAVLKDTQNLLFDFSANTNAWVFAQLLRAVGPRRVLFGSDLPILRMRMRRITEHGIYINVVPKGLYGDVSGDRNMREVDGAEAARLTFFMYEELAAFRRAAEECGLSRDDVENVFYGNARRLLAALQTEPRP